jgi:tetratricopeptide (TPR) repeat protein
VSRQRGCWLHLIVLIAMASGCATSNAQVEKIRAQAAYERGLSYLGERQPTPALVALREAVRINPAEPRYHDSLGLLLLNLGQIDQALEHLRRALELDPRFADGHFHLGVALAETRRWSDAVKSYTTAIGLPTLTVPDLAHSSLGMAFYNLKRYREAETALRYAISLNPELQAAYYHLGLVLVGDNRKDEAKSVFREARKLGPDSPFGQAAAAQLKDLGEGG